MNKLIGASLRAFEESREARNTEIDQLGVGYSEILKRIKSALPIEHQKLLEELVEIVENKELALQNHYFENGFKYGLGGIEK